MKVELNEVECRVLGCLIEKENTTPDYYPLTLNALTNACNQKSNRFPVVNYTEEWVETALDSLRAKNLVYVLYGGGSRTAKYKHLFPTFFDVELHQFAILCVLLLRGPQTPGEINQRTSRIYKFISLDEVTQTIDGLIDRDDPLIIKLPKQPGQKSGLFAHLLSGEVNVEDIPVIARPTAAQAKNERIEKLEEKVKNLAAEFSELKEVFEEFKKQFE